MLIEYGHKLGEPHSKPLRDKISELRIITERGHFRILYFFNSKNAVVLTHSIAKKTRTVPNREINLAIKRMKKFKADPVKHTF